jgi:hypothetical protein
LQLRVSISLTESGRACHARPRGKLLRQLFD